MTFPFFWKNKLRSFGLVLMVGLGLVDLCGGRGRTRRHRGQHSDLSLWIDEEQVRVFSGEGREE